MHLQDLLVIQCLCSRFWGGDPGLTGKLLLKVSEKTIYKLTIAVVHIMVVYNVIPAS